jgi:hypothetical protein
LADGRAEEGASKPAVLALATKDKPEDLDTVWKQLNAKAEPVTAATTSEAVATVDTVKIKRTYEFAGQVVTYVGQNSWLMYSEEKEVPRDSAEANAYISSLHTSTTPNTTGQNAKPAVRRAVKRTSKLEAMAQSGKPQKLNVLEKSRLDWAGFVDKEGIHDELKRHNKDGYVERQEFLKRTR